MVSTGSVAYCAAVIACMTNFGITVVAYVLLMLGTFSSSRVGIVETVFKVKSGAQLKLVNTAKYSYH